MDIVSRGASLLLLLLLSTRSISLYYFIDQLWNGICLRIWYVNLLRPVFILILTCQLRLYLLIVFLPFK